MKWDALEEEPCSLARTVAVIGDRWSLLILRECFLRIRRFDEFQSSLGITRHLLADRLKKLVRFGVLRKIPYQDAPKRYEYILTQKGLDLYPIIMSIVHWGNIHMVDSRGRPLLHEHKNCQKMFDPVMVCSECGEPLTAKAVHVHPGPGDTTILAGAYQGPGPKQDDGLIAGSDRRERPLCAQERSVAANRLREGARGLEGCAARSRTAL